MMRRLGLARLPVLLGAALFTIHCTDAAAPDRKAPPLLTQTEAGSGGIQLDQQNGSLGESGTILIKGFNPTNPHLGDAIVATFFWFGAPGGLTGNIIETVTDQLANGTPVGNAYTLVEFVSDGTVSMATYLATNVQNFPDASTNGAEILVVKASLKTPVVDGGIAISAWIGVAGTTSQALGERRSGSGLASPLSSPTTADPGSISLNPGALAYGVSLASPPAGVEGPGGWTRIGTGSDLFMTTDGEYDAQFTVSTTGGTAHPQWSWFFTGTGTWLATVLALNPAPTTGNLTTTTSTSGENLPTSDFTVTLDGTTSQPISPTGEHTFNSLQPGSHEVSLSGVPANCEVTSANSVTVTVVAGETATASFTVSCSSIESPPPPPPPPPPPNDFVTGGGKLKDGREFATFGLQATASGGNFQWVQHCPDGPNAASAHCAQGKFTFHGTVTGSYAETTRGPKCRTWTGTGSSKQTGAQSFTVREACDGGEPGRGADYLEVAIGSYENSGYLSGGNIQLHRSKS